MTALNAEVIITSWHPGPHGGGVAVGRVREGNTVKVVVPAALVGREPRPGESWRIRGRGEADRFTADAAMPLMPRGSAITRWIAANPALPGVGRKTAERIWKHHGADLYRILRDGDVPALAKGVPLATATAIVAEFTILRDEVAVLEAFDFVGVGATIAIAACRLWGKGAVEKLRSDPYCIVALETWRDVDARALRTGIEPDDDRRLLAAVAEVMSARFRSRDASISGHTAARREDVERGVERLLPVSRELARQAFDMALDRGELIDQDRLFQARAPWRMERDIERAVGERIARGGTHDELALARAFAAVTAETGVTLSDEQRIAATTAVTAGFSIIDGAAGTGKSTVTRAISGYADEIDLPYIQIALSGRAAKRLAEATGRDAMTVHRFIKAVTHGKLELGRGFLLVDEVSMLGTPDLWQLLSWTPRTMDVVVVGDPGQLPPITAGDPLRALTESSCVSRSTLTIIRRQSSDSAIPLVAGEIRQGKMPALPDYRADHADVPGVSLLRCNHAEIAGRILDVFESLVGPPATGPDRDALRGLHAARVQILGATRNGQLGVRELAASVERRWLVAQPRVHDWGLSHGSKVLWTRNSYDHPTGKMDGDGRPVTADIMNGSLGIVQRATADGATVLFDDADATKVEILRRDLERIERGWAITVHKAQGSAFDRVIIPVTPGRLMDRLLIYTAITRARVGVVLVGPERDLAEAIAAEPRSLGRLQRLDFDATPTR